LVVGDERRENAWCRSLPWPGVSRRVKVDPSRLEELWERSASERYWLEEERRVLGRAQRVD
jgi:hypothetical protein